MISSSSKASKVNTAKDAATPNFVLTLLAACSNSVPAAGQEGEGKICEQLSGLITDKKMAVTELSLLYSYKFGFNIKDALKFTGFQGQLEEFLAEQKRFLLQDGFICMKPPTVEKQLPTALEFLGKSIDDEETASNADTESTTDAEGSQLDDDSDVDVIAWQSIGTRIADALSDIDDNEVDELRWKALGSRVAAVFDSDADEEDVENVTAWRKVGCSIVAVLSSDDGEDDDDGKDIAAWRDVGDRIVRACSRSSNEDDAQEVEPAVAAA